MKTKSTWILVSHRPADQRAAVRLPSSSSDVITPPTEARGVQSTGTPGALASEFLTSPPAVHEGSVGGSCALELHLEPFSFPPGRLA